MAGDNKPQNQNNDPNKNERCEALRSKANNVAHGVSNAATSVVNGVSSAASHVGTFFRNNWNRCPLGKKADAKAAASEVVRPKGP